MRFHIRPGVRRLFRLAPRTNAAARADIDDELESLIASRVDALVAHGMSPDDARAEAVRRLGISLTEVRRRLHHFADQQERRMQFRERFESVMQDVHYAARGLVRRPAFTAVAVITLAIGIGATTAIFSAVNVLLIRPLPYPHPDELMKVSLVTPPRGDRPGTTDMVWSYPKFTTFRDVQHAFSDLAIYTNTQVTLTSGEIARVAGEQVGATYLRVLGLRPVRGRDFDRSIDAHPDAPRQVLLSYELWEHRFNADPSIVGSVIDIDQQPWTVIGVTPRDFRGLTGQAQLFLDLNASAADELNQPQNHSYWAVARRAAGVTPAQAEAITIAAGARVSDAYPSQFSKGKWSAHSAPLNDSRLAPVVRRSLLILFGAVGFVLLIACVNVASLLLGRASTRRREIAVRLAIGAGRARLARLLVTESVLLAVIGAAASIVVAWTGVHALGTIDPATTLRLRRDSGLGAMAFSAITLDWRALAFTLGVSLIVGLLFGLAPAIGATRASLTDGLKDGRDRVTHRTLGRRALVVLEVALALVLLAGSGLMLRSLAKLLAIDPGFDTHHVLTFRLTVPPSGYQRDSMPGFYTQLLGRLRAVPGVDDASIANCAPLSGGCNATGIQFADRPKVPLGDAPTITADWISPTWLSTMRVPLKMGRAFTDADRLGAPKVIIVNEVAAKTFWPNENPIGKHIAIGQGGYDDAEVIGIAGNVRQRPDSQPKPGVYVSYLQSPRSGMMIFVRSSRDLAALAPEVRRAVHDVAPQLPVYDLLPMTDRAAAATAQARFSAVLLALFAGTALALAAVGIYGVMSLGVVSRTREIGIRIALGADRGRVQRLVVGEGMALVSLGAAVGLGGAVLCTRVLRTLLFDLTPSDPVTYTAIVILLAMTAVAASWLPARRASRVDPLEALRAE